MRAHRIADGYVRAAIGDSRERMSPWIKLGGTVDRAALGGR